MAICGYGHTRRLPTSTPFRKWETMSWSGALPSSRHCSIKPRASKLKFSTPGARPVAHARDHEESHRRADRLRAQLLHHRVVVIDRHLGRHGRVAPPVDQQEFSASREEPAQVGVNCVHRLDLRTVRRRHAVEVDRPRLVVPRRIAQDVVLEELDRDAERLIAAGKLCPSQLAARVERR